MNKRGAVLRMPFVGLWPAYPSSSASQLGFPALRVQKHYLAFVTLAFSVLCWLVFRNETAVTGGVMGLRDIERPSPVRPQAAPAPSTSTGSCWRSRSAMTFVLWWIVRSPWGRAFAALRENPLRAESLGVDVRAYTLLAFALGSAYGGMAGSLYAPLVEFIDPSPLALAEPSLLFMLMVVISGSGTFLGPFVGARASPCCCPNGCAPGDLVPC